MATWNSRGLRGSTLEELINRTNEQYREKGLALIQKIPTPITPVKMDKTSRHITLAYFEQKSTVDYIGAVQGIPVFYYLTLRKLKEFWKRMEDGGRKSFRREELDEEFYLSGKNGFLVPYLEGIQKDLQLRD